MVLVIQEHLNTHMSKSVCVFERQDDDIHHLILCDSLPFKALVYTLCEDNLVPWLCYSFSDISLSVCLFMCVYMMLVALSMCSRVGAGIVGGSQVFQ